MLSSYIRSYCHSFPHSLFNSFFNMGVISIQTLRLLLLTRKRLLLIDCTNVGGSSFMYCGNGLITILTLEARQSFTSYRTEILVKNFYSLI